MTRQTKITLLTSAVLVAGLLYYFFVYAENRKDLLHRQNYRMLQQIASNIEQKFISLRKSAKNQKNTDFIPNTFEQTDLKEAGITDGSICPDSIRRVTSESLYLFYTDGEANLLFVSDTIGARGDMKMQQRPERKAEACDTGIVLRLPLQNLMRGLLADAFDEYVLFRNGEVVYSTLPAAYNATPVKDSLKQVPRISLRGINYLYYEQPIRMGENSEWMLTGLKDSRVFSADQFRVSLFIIIILAILFLVFTAGMPFLKLLLLGRKEQLDGKDILYISSGVVLGSMLVTLLFLDIFDYAFSKREKVEHELEALSDSVTYRFRRELGAMYEELRDLDSIYVREFAIDSIEKVEMSNLLQKKKWAGKHYPYFIQMSWMDSSGNQGPFFKWTTRSKTTKGISVKERYYFSGVQKPTNLWKFAGMKGDGFVLEQIISWNTGEYLTVMGMPSRKKGEKGMPFSVSLTAKPVSVTNPVLEKGYQFAIINEEGKVLYHSDSRKSFHENLLEESQHNGRLRSAMYSRHESTFTLDYQGKSYKAYAQPVPGTEYTIVTMANKEYYRTANMVVLSAGGLMAIFLFFLYGVQFFVKRVVTYRKSMLEYKVPQFTWLRPDKSLDVQYGKVAIGHLVHFFILGFFIFLIVWQSDSAKIIPLLYLGPTIAVYFSYFRLAYQEGSTSRRENRGMRVAAGIILFIVFGVTIKVYESGGLVLYLLVYLFTAAFAYRFLLFDSEKLNGAFKKSFTQSAYYQWYCRRNRYYLFLLSFMVLLSVTPVTGFYISASNNEAALARLSSMLSFSRGLEQKVASFEELTEDRKGLGSRPEIEGFSYYLENATYPYSDQAYFLPQDSISYAKMERLSDTADKEDTEVEEGVAYIVSHVRPFFNDLVIENNGLIYSKATDESFVVYDLNEVDENDLQAIGNNDLSDTLRKRDIMMKYNGHNLALPYYLVSPAEMFSPLRNHKGEYSLLRILVFTAIVIIGMMLLYMLIRFSIQKIFLYQRLERPSIKFDTEVLDMLVQKQDVFIIGMPLSGRSYKLKEFKKGFKEEELEVIDFRTWEPRSRLVLMEKVKAKRYILLEHVEYNWSVEDFNELKLTFIGDLLASRTSDQRFIMCSAMHPHSMSAFSKDQNLNLRRFTNMIKTFVKVFFPINSDESALKARQKEHSSIIKKKILALHTEGAGGGLQRLKAFLNKFYLVPQRNTDRDRQIRNIRYVQEVEEAIIGETVCGHYLQGLREPLFRYFRKRIEDGNPGNLLEEVVLKVQSMAGLYYQSLWNFLTVEEKVVVIDMARDTLVNDRNTRIITALINKGIFRFDVDSERVYLFNRSFRNFVLTRLTDKEEKEMLSEIKGHASWETFKTPAIIIAVTIVLFLFATQQETVDKLIAFISASAASITVVARVLSGVFNKRKETVPQ